MRLVSSGASTDEPSFPSWRKSLDIEGIFVVCDAHVACGMSAPQAVDFAQVSCIHDIQSNIVVPASSIACIYKVPTIYNNV